MQASNRQPPPAAGVRRVQYASDQPEPNETAIDRVRKQRAASLLTRKRDLERAGLAGVQPTAIWCGGLPDNCCNEPAIRRIFDKFGDIRRGAFRPLLPTHFPAAGIAGGVIECLDRTCLQCLSGGSRITRRGAL